MRCLQNSKFDYFCFPLFQRVKLREILQVPLMKFIIPPYLLKQLVSLIRVIIFACFMVSVGHGPMNMSVISHSASALSIQF